MAASCTSVWHMSATPVFVTTTARVDSQPFEIVERKGVGHPDTLADGVAEAISNAYARYCLQEFGAVLHHHFDKTLIMGGQATIDFGLGELVKPIRLVINGRVSSMFGKRIIKYQELQEAAAKDCLHRALPHLDVTRNVEIHTFSTSYSRSPFWYRPRGLEDLPEHQAPFINDSSAIVSFWPLSQLERAVLEVEKYFYDETGKPRFAYLCQDIKILALRNGQRVQVTVAVPFLSPATPNKAWYEEKLAQIHADLQHLLQRMLGARYSVHTTINAQDYDLLDVATARKSCYLTATGSALDYGEEGVVGRGNRARGIRSSLRPNSTDAIHGKNPTFHVGKVYTYFGDRISRAIAEELACECTVVLATQNKRPTHAPQSVFVQISDRRSEQAIKHIVERELSKTGWVNAIIEDDYFLPMPGKSYG